jgi:hypothetical protein
MEDATLLGLPSIQFIKEIEGSSWDASVYAGLHQFHQAKGFNPESQEVALHLGYPLYEIDVPFVHGKFTFTNRVEHSALTHKY